MAVQQTGTNKSKANKKQIGKPAVPTALKAHNSELVHHLNEILANEFILFTRTLNYHWNITGPRFQQVHKFLDEHYHKLLEIMDQVAERVRILGSRPLSTVEEMENEMSITEKPGKFPDTDGMLRDLAADHNKIMELMRDALADESLFERDPVTEDFLIRLLNDHELMHWMIRSHFTETAQ